MVDTEISDSIKYLGADDRELNLFESQYVLKNGMSYNSYLIKDKKNVILDTIDRRVTNVWLEKLERELDGEKPDYLVVSHLEPDHAYNIGLLLEKYPEMKIIGNTLTFNMLPNFFDISNLGERKILVKEGDTINIGEHTLQFIMAPMVHWPEVMMTYEQKEKILFSADAFGKFGTVESEEEWLPEARRYYFGIVGKYGPQVQAVLKKASTLDIKTICPLHGPILKENLGYYLKIYDTWSSYKPEKDGIFIACASIYGNTFSACEKLKDILEKDGAKEVKLFDLTRQDMAEAVAEAFKYSKIIFAASSYNAGVFTPMAQFLQKLKERNFQNRKVGIIENGSWAPSAAKNIKEVLQQMKDIDIICPAITIKSTVKPEDINNLKEFANNIIKG